MTPTIKEVDQLILILQALPEVEKKITKKANFALSLASKPGYYTGYMAMKAINGLVEFLDTLTKRGVLTERDAEVCMYMYM